VRGPPPHAPSPATHHPHGEDPVRVQKDLSHPPKVKVAEFERAGPSQKRKDRAGRVGARLALLAVGFRVGHAHSALRL